MTRFVDRGAVIAGWVGVGMALTIAVSFLLVIPIGDVALSVFAPLSGLMIGYYANQRSGRQGGPWPRLALNAAYAGAATGIAFAVLLILTKALFFVADDGYRDPSSGGRLSCQPGADCVYQRYVAFGKDADLRAAGVIDASSFVGFYWSQQAGTAGTLILLSIAGGLIGGGVYGLTNRRPPAAVAAPTSA